MCYAIIYAEHALDRIAALLKERDAPGAANHLDDAMDRLAQNPVTLSRPARHPHPSRGQCFTFSLPLGGGQRIKCRAHFLYDANESELRVFDITHDDDTYLCL